MISSDEEIYKVFKYILSLNTENEWIEYKHNNADPDMIGEYISSLCNSAILEGQDKAYLIYGVDNQKNIVGTNFCLENAKKGEQELKNYLCTMLKPCITFTAYNLVVDNEKIVVVIEIDTNTNIPVKFKGVEYFRLNSTQKKLKEFPEVERKLWRCFDNRPFEIMLAKKNVSEEDIFELLDYDIYFNLLGMKHNLNKEFILDKLIESEFIIFKRGVYNITNLGAIVLAKDLNNFNELKLRTPRVIVYEGSNRINTLIDQIGNKGYAVSFEQLIDYINDKVQNREVIKNALRENIVQYPKIAIRETVANALVHQDFMEGNKGPFIEIFKDRIEITNSGKPLISTKRFIDHTPKSRNEKLANMMRILKICEEKGSGVDKVITSIEEMHLPAPEYEEYEDSLRVILYAYKEYKSLTEIERIRATYQHCCLKYVNKCVMTNSTLRERFRIEKQNGSMITRIINITLKKGFIKYYDPSSNTRKFKKYIPYWA